MSNIENKPATNVKFLIFSASLRKDSYNTQLAQLAVRVIEQNGGAVDYALMSDFECPSMNQDLEQNGYQPEGATELRRRILASNAFIIVSPEYNGSMPGYLKNTIDWVSRFRPQPFNEQHAMLMSASPSMAGGNRALWSLRIPFEHLGTNVYPNMFSLAIAHKAFASDGSLSDATLQQRFETNLISFMNLVEATTHYPCIKKAWVEFLGEQPDPAIERVE